MKIPKGKITIPNRRTDNTMAKRKGTKGQTTIYKTKDQRWTQVILQCNVWEGPCNDHYDNFVQCNVWEGPCNDHYDNFVQCNVWEGPCNDHYDNFVQCNVWEGPCNDHYDNFVQCNVWEGPCNDHYDNFVSSMFCNFWEDFFKYILP